MKIALVAHEINDNGGMERCMANLARWLKALGETVHLYTADDSCPLAEEGFTWQQIPTVKKPLALRLWLFYQRSGKIIPWKEYDIIHTNGGIVPYQNVTTIHCCQPAWEQILQDPQIRSFYKGSQQWRLWNRKIGSALATHLERQTVLNSKLIFCVSNKVAREVGQFYHPRIQPQVVYNGVSLEAFYPASNYEARHEFRASMGARPEDTVLLFAGEFGHKGLKTALECLTLQRSPYYKLWVVGKDPLEAQFRQMVAQWHLSENVSFLGFRNDLPDLMRAADIFVHPTHYDTFGLVVLEAMASGLPVITTLQAGVSELLITGINGFVIDSPHNANMMSQVLEMLRSNPLFAHHIGQAALKTAQRYSWNRMAESMYLAYTELLADESARLLSNVP